MLGLARLFLSITIILALLGLTDLAGVSAGLIPRDFEPRTRSR